MLHASVLVLWLTALEQGETGPLVLNRWTFNDSAKDDLIRYLYAAAGASSAGTSAPSSTSPRLLRDIWELPAGAQGLRGDKGGVFLSLPSSHLQPEAERKHPNTLLRAGGGASWCNMEAWRWNKRHRSHESQIKSILFIKPKITVTSRRCSETHPPDTVRRKLPTLSRRINKMEETLRGRTHRK